MFFSALLGPTGTVSGACRFSGLSESRCLPVSVTTGTSHEKEKERTQASTSRFGTLEITDQLLVLEVPAYQNNRSSTGTGKD